MAGMPSACQGISLAEIAPPLAKLRNIKVQSPPTARGWRGGVGVYTDWCIEGTLILQNVCDSLNQIQRLF